MILCTVVLVGDTQATSFFEFWREKNDRERALILDRIADENPDFIVHVGDVTVRGSSKREWDDFNKKSCKIREKSIPIFPALGNHDYWGRNKTALRNYFANMPLTKGKIWYSFTNGPLAFIMLNSNFDQMDRESIEKQKEFFEDCINRYDREDRIKMITLVSHHPPFTNSRIVKDDEGVKKNFLKTFLSSKKAKIMFSGHCHSYEHFSEENKHFLVTGGGGGPRHRLETNPMKRRHEDLYKDPSGAGKCRPFHYCKMVTDHKTARIEVIGLNKGAKEFKLLDEFELAIG